MTMKLHKPLAIGLAAAMLTGCLGGCTPKDDDSSSSSQSSSGGASAQNAVVDIFQFKVEISEALQAAIDQYLEDHPGVKINLETVGGGDDYGASLRAKMQSGDAAEIYNIGGPQDTQDWLSKLEDLSDQPWVEYAVEGTLEGVTLDDKVYGMPYSIEGYGIIYNKAIFDAAGIDGEAINSFDSMASAFQTLKEQIDSGALSEQFPALKAVFELPAKEKWVTGLHTLNVALTNEFDGPMDAYQSETVEFVHSDALKALFDLQADYTENAASKSKLNAVDYATQVGGGLAIERVAAIQQGNWIYSEVLGVDETVAENLRMMPIPLKGVVEDSIPIGVPMYWCVNRESSDADKAAAKEFLNWLYQSDEGKQIVVEQFYFIPPFTNYEGIEPQDPLGQEVKRYADAGKTMPWVFMGFPTAWGENVFGVELQKYLAGEEDWNQVIENARAGWEESRKTASSGSQA